MDEYSNDTGRVEIYHNGEWGSVCKDRWGDMNARVICRYAISDPISYYRMALTE